MAASGGVTGDYESIATVLVGSGGTSSIDFTSLSTDYKHLQIRANYLTSADVALLRFNGTTSGSTAYDFHGIRGNGSTASAYAVTSTPHVQIGTGLGASTTIYGLVIDILDFANTNKNTTVKLTYGYDNNGSGQIEFFSGLWRSTAAVTSIKILPASGVISQHSQFALYGLKG